MFYLQKQTHKLCIVFFTITICKKRQKHSINSPRNSPHKATIVIIGNYSRKLRFSDAKSPKRATMYSFQLPLFLKLKFPFSSLFRSEILPKLFLWVENSLLLCQFLPFFAVFCCFSCCFLLFLSLFYRFYFIFYVLFAIIPDAPLPFLPQNCDFSVFLGVFCCFSCVFLFHVKLFCNNRLRTREVVEGNNNTV